MNIGRIALNREKATSTFAEGSDEDILGFLTIHGVNQLGKHGENALHWATMLGRIKLVTRLLETDINIDVPDHNNYRTPLMWAVKGLKEAINTPGKENMVTKYEEIITQLVTKGANLDKEDYLEVTPRDILDELEESEDLQKSVRNRDPYILPRKMDLSLDADDTSDEEISDNVSEYNCKDNWEKFKKDKAFQNLRSMGLSEEQISDTFVCHFKGIQYLYAKPVNQFFYHDKLYGKNRLSDSKLPDNELIERWFFDALLATCKQVIAKIPPEEEITDLELRGIINKQIDKALPRLLSQKRLILRQARLHKASARQVDLYKPHEEHLKKFVEMEKKAHKKDGSRKYLDEFKEKNGLKTLPTKRLIPESPHQMTPELVRQLSGSRGGDNTHLIHVLVNGLLRRASLIVQFETFLPEGKEVENRNIEDLIQVFDKTFYAELSRLRKKYSVIISRGITTPIYFSPFENSKSDKISELGLFRDIRIVNRLQKRLMKHDEQSSHVFGDEDAKEGKLTIDLSWNLRNTQVHTIAYSITKTNHMRVNLLRAGASADYPAIAGSIAQIKAKFPSVTDAMIAGWIRQIVQGKSVMNGHSDPHFKTLSTLAALLFICEPERNPAAFIGFCRNKKVFQVYCGQ